jgi:hypothetical protein
MESRALFKEEGLKLFIILLRQRKVKKILYLVYLSFLKTDSLPTSEIFAHPDQSILILKPLLRKYSFTSLTVCSR